MFPQFLDRILTPLGGATSWGAIALALLTSLASAVSAQEARILVIGDSVMEWNGARSIPSVMADRLGEPVRDESVSGARFSHRMRMLVGPMDIRSQIPRVDFDWLVLTGGANDLAAECNCGACGDVLDALISEDTRLGEIPDFLEEITAGGARVIWAQYYDDPAGGGPFSDCASAFATLDQRLDTLAVRMEGVYMADMSAVIDPTNASHYDMDRVHPSPIGSERIGVYLAERLRALD